MRKTLLIAAIIYFLTGGGLVQALEPIQIKPQIEKVIILPSNTPTPVPVKLIKPSIKFELVSTPKATATPTITVVVVTATPTVTGTIAPTATVTDEPTPTVTTATPSVIPTTEVKTKTSETIPWYIMVTIGALIGIIVVQAWPKKTVDKEE